MSSGDVQIGETWEKQVFWEVKGRSIDVKIIDGLDGSTEIISQRMSKSIKLAGRRKRSDPYNNRAGNQDHPQMAGGAGKLPRDLPQSSKAQDCRKCTVSCILVRKL